MSSMKNNLHNKIKYLYKLFKEELENNKESLEWLDALKDEQYNEIYDKLDYKKSADTPQLLAQKEIDKRYIDFYNEYAEINTKLLIYRNFLLVLYFMRNFHRSYTDTIKKESATSLQSFILQKIKEEPTAIRTQYQKLFGKDSTTNILFKQFITKAFEGIDTNFISNIDLNIENLAISGTGNEDDFQHNKFINYWIDLLKEVDEAIIGLFFETLVNDYKTFNVPTSMATFLRYYTYNDSLGNRNNAKSVYFSGVGTSVLIANFVRDSKNRRSDGFGRKLTIGTDDNNEISLQIRTIRHRLITDDIDIFSNINNSNILDTSVADNSYDVVISIPPENLSLLETSVFINNKQDDLQHNVQRYINYNPLPKRNLSCLIHYYNAKRIANNKILMVVPISFITLNDYVKNLQNHNNMFDGGRNQFSESEISSMRFKEIVEEQLITKVMLLPKGMFEHTKEQCVLLEVSKTTNDSVRFIDGTQFTITSKNKTVIYNTNAIKNAFDNTEDNYYKDKKHEQLVSKYVDYHTIITALNYNMLPSFHLTTQANDTQVTNPISDLFSITKAQRFNEVNGRNTKEKKEEIDISFLSKSNFNQFNISTPSDGQTKRAIIKNINNFANTSRLRNNDILIHTNYVNNSDITFIELNKNDICIANHNLIIIRSTSNNAIESQKLFLWLMSERGHNYLLSILKNTNGTNILKIDDLKNIPIFYNDIEKDLFSKIRKKSMSIQNQIKSLKKLYS